MRNLKEMTDEQLAIAYSEGDNRAFDVLLARNQSKLYSYILFLVRDRSAADDVFQDTFVKAIYKLRQGLYSPSGQFAAWLTRIAHNVIFDMFRAKKHEGIVDKDDSELANIGGSGAMEGGIEERFVESQTLREAQMLMESLPAPQREVVYMRIYQQLSFKEIAETTGVSINTALGRMRYAILNMRRMADEHNIAI